MAVYSSKITVGYLKAAADYSSNQFYAVNIDANGDWELADALGQAIDGVICEPAASGLALGVDISGVVKGVASAAITAGDSLSVAASGKFKTAASGETIVGIAQSAAGADGEVISLLLGYRGVAP